MNQKRIFNLKQFYQSFLQMKIIGFISMTIFVLLSVFVPVNDLMSFQNNRAQGIETSSTILVNFLTDNYFLMMMFMVVAPLLTLYAWNFLTKRNASDFMHSLPYTRKCTYISNVLAIVAWQFLILVACAVSVCIVYLIFHSVFIVDYMIVLRTYLVIFGCSLLCTGAISLACMLTGTLFSNICVSGLIIFFPRFLLTLCSSMVSSSVPVAVSEHIIPMVDSNSNIVTGVVFGILFSDGVADTLLNIAGNIYTYVLALIYLILAGVLFVRRKSETAGKGAVNAVLQHVIRVLIGFCVTSIGVMSLVSNLRSGYYQWNNEIFTIFIIMLISAILIIVYECINSKSFRSIKKCIPSILITYALSVIFFFAANGWINSILQYRPTADSIDYVTFSNVSSNYYNANSNDYFTSCTSRAKLDDERVIKVLCEALSNNLERFEQDPDSYNYYVYRNNMECVNVTFYQGIVPTYRTVELTQEQYKEVSEYLGEIDNFKQVYKDIPKFDDASISWVFGTDYDMTTEQSNALYDIFYEEVQSMDFDQWYQEVNASDAGYQQFTVYGEFTRNGKCYTFSIPITELMPNTMQAIIQYINNCNIGTTETGELADVLQSYASGLKYASYQDIYFTFFDPETHTSNQIDVDDLISLVSPNGNQIIEKMGEEVEIVTKENQIDLSKPYILIRYTSTGDKNSNLESIDFSDSYNTICQTVAVVIQLDGYDSITDYYTVGSEGVE